MIACKGQICVNHAFDLQPSSDDECGRQGLYITLTVIPTHVTCIGVMELSTYETCSTPSLRGLSFLSMKPTSALREPAGRDL